MLGQIDQTNAAPKYKLLAALFRKELWNLQYTVQGGGGQLSRGDLELSRLKEKESVEELDSTIAVISGSLTDPQDLLDAADASRLLDIFSVCELTKVNLRLARFQNVAPTPGVTPPRLEVMKTYCDAGNLQWPESILPSIDRALLRSSLLADLDESAGDITTARSELQAGLTAAQTARRQVGVIYFLLRLGDSFLSPEGDAHTIGYDLATDTAVRLVRQYDPSGIKSSVPITSDDIDTAERNYSEAHALAQHITGLKDDHEFALRAAYIALIRGDPSAASLYRSAAVNAVDDSAARMASLYRAVYALIETSPAVFSDAVKSLMENDDAGGIVSCAEMARAYASRTALNGNVDIATADLRIAIASLEPSHFYHAEADLQEELANTYGVEFRSDLALATALEAVKNRNAFLAEAQSSAHFDQGLVVSEKESEVVSVQFLVGELSLRSSTEGGDAWRNLQKRFNELLPQLNRTLQVSDYQDFAQREFPAVQRKISIMANERAWFRSAQDCKSFLSQYPQYENAAQSFGDPDLLLQIRLPAALCDSTRMQEFKASIAKLSPIDSLEGAVASAGNMPPTAAEQMLLKMQLTLQTDFTLADQTRQFDLMLSWAEALGQLISRKPGLVGFSSMAFGYKAHALIGLGKPQDAIGMLTGIQDDPLQWNKLTRSYRIQVLQDLTQANMQAGDLEASIAALESAKLEVDREEASRSGLQIEDKETAEIAMLRRQYIQQAGDLPAGELKKLTASDAQVAASERPLSDHLESKTDVHNSIERLPEGSSLLIYTLWGDSIGLFQVTKTGGVHAYRSPCDVYDVSRAILQLRASVADARPSWGDWARHLYDCLLPNGLQLNRGSPLIVSLPEELFGFPFEILTSPSQVEILHDHPVIYARFLSKHGTGDVSQQAPATHRSRLVVGVDGPTLSNAEDEATEVGRLLHVSPLLGSAANEASVSKAMDGAQIIHLSTHASMDSSNPYLSYLALAGNQEIQAWQIFQHALDADLVFLSACDTDVESGSSAFNFTSSGGAVGLAAFFQGTNVGWTVASLWRADDKSTKRIVSGFYAALDSGETNPAIALQNAKLQSAAQPESSLPFYYAPLIISIRSAIDAGHPVDTR
ncbi:MAG: CHAT domain-containing protein [Terracidiphilus sp.]